MTTRFMLKAFLFAAVATFGVSGGRCSAAKGSIDRENGIVYIEGDNYNDTCYVTLDGDDIEIELTVYDASGMVSDTDDRDYDLDDVLMIVFQGFSGNDHFYNYTPVPCTAKGGAGNDVLMGGSGDDDLYGGSGSDWLYGRDGDDDLFGDEGPDALLGGNDEDYLKAGTGEDELYILGQGDSDTFSTPATLNFFSRSFLPLNRSVIWEDFNPNEDTEILFWAPVVYTPVLFTIP